MANSFKQCILLFKSTTERVSGEEILKELSNVFDIDSSDVQVNEYSVEIRFVTAEAHDDMLERCNSVKGNVDSAHHERLFYKLTVMSL